MEQGDKETILIVDDTQFMRKMLRDIFEKCGFEIVGEASNGKEAVELYGELSPDLTTMDISMPEMDGIEALKAIIKIDPEAQVLMVSAMGFQGKVLEAVKAGAKNFIVKPLDEQKVIDIVNRILKK